MILQIMPTSRFTSGFISFMNSQFDAYDVHFITYGRPRVPAERVIVAPNVTTVDDVGALLSRRDCRQAVLKSDALVINQVDPRVLMSVGAACREKLALMFWGGDLHGFRRGASLPIRALKRVALRIIEQAPVLITLVPSDYRFLRTICHPHGAHFVAPMWGDEPPAPDRSPTARAVRDTDSQATIILVGNSATVTNRHLDALKMLGRYSSEDIRVIAPLSYGDGAYRDEVMRAGATLFGRKFEPLTELMEPADYARLLEGVSVGVFNHDRQQGLGNIYALLGGGAKVFVSTDSGMGGDLRDEGLRTFQTEAIPSLGFDGFCAYPSEVRAANVLNASREARRNRAVERWERVLAHLSRLP